MSTLFLFKHADIAIGAQTILCNIDWEIRKGQHTWLTGNNSSGKTTLCRAITGRYRIRSGKGNPVNLDYGDIRMVSFTDDGKLFNSINNVHYYQQRFNSWDADGHLKTKEYLLASGVDPTIEENKAFIEEIGLSELLDIERIKLSSGQTRKLLLSSALLHQPKLLILDNPYIGLDAESRSFLNKFLDELVTNNDITLILSGQATTLPACIQNQLILEEGNIVFDGRIADKQNDKLIDRIHSEKTIKNNECREQAGFAFMEILNLEKINISYSQKVVLQIDHWRIEKGDRWALMGNNGSGKSTLVSLVYADHPQAYSQNISIFGSRLGPGRSIWDIKKHIGFTSPELHAYFRTDLTAEEVVWTGLFDKFELMAHVDDHQKKLCQDLFEYYGLCQIMSANYAQLSTGHQRICLFIRALIKRPALLLLDEPFQGLDIRNIELSKNLLNRFIHQTQTILFISHFEDEIPTCVQQFFNLSNLES